MTISCDKANLLKIINCLLNDCTGLVQFKHTNKCGMDLFRLNNAINIMESIASLFRLYTITLFQFSSSHTPHHLASFRKNQIYVVMSGNVDNLPNVANMDSLYAQSCILTPLRFPFARDGIAADTTPNVETVAFADLPPETLTMARNSGTVMNLRDRRHDR